MEFMMRVFTQFVMAAACAAAVVGCSEVESPVMTESGTSSKSSAYVAIVPIFIEYDDIKGEAINLEEAMDIYSGVGAETAALLLPAVQKVREAMAELEEGANREGMINANDAEKTFRKLINTDKPDGDEYAVKDVFHTSTAKGKDGKHVDEIPIESYKNNDAAQVEFQLFHIFTGIRKILDDARVNDDAIDRALDGVLAAIADLSEERP
jgi:type IV secretory pathway TrbF-like protein